MSEITPVVINQRVAILVDGNNIGIAIRDKIDNENAVLNFKTFIPKLLSGRGLNRLYYFREGKSISAPFTKMLHEEFFGVVVPCGKSVDVYLTITGTEIADKVDTIIILSGDGDYIPLVKHLQSRGVRVEVSCVGSAASAKLVEIADYYTEISNDDCLIMRPPNVHRTPSSTT
jgi:uncharacterized LabA/DUF88 family protein